MGHATAHGALHFLRTMLMTSVMEALKREDKEMRYLVLRGV